MAVNLLDAGPSQTPGTPYITIFQPRGKNTTIIQQVKPLFFEKGAILTMCQIWRNMISFL
jgi:hypothetical protein